MKRAEATAARRMRPDDEAVKSMVLEFFRSVHWLKSLHYAFNALFVREDDKKLLAQSAEHFFGDLNQILVDYILLEVAKLSDRAGSRRSQRTTLSVDHLLSAVEWPADCLSAIDNARKSVSNLGKYIRPARDKVFAHRDVDAALSGVPLGAFPDGKDVECIEALELVANELHRASFGRIRGSMRPGNVGDACSLKSRLVDALTFERLLAESSGEERDRLYALRESVLEIGPRMKSKGA